MRITMRDWVQCITCDKIDMPARGNTGTRKTMICDDCNLPNVSDRAASCRDCCPSGHHTRFEVQA